MNAAPINPRSAAGRLLARGRPGSGRIVADLVAHDRPADPTSWADHGRRIAITLPLDEYDPHSADGRMFADALQRAGVDFRLDEVDDNTLHVTGDRDGVWTVVLAHARDPEMARELYTAATGVPAPDHDNELEHNHGRGLESRRDAHATRSDAAGHQGDPRDSIVYVDHEPARAAHVAATRGAEVEQFNFWRDVIGDDTVFGGVVYSAEEWTWDEGGDGVRRLTDTERADQRAEYLLKLDAAGALDTKLEARERQDLEDRVFAADVVAMTNGLMRWDGGDQPRPLEDSEWYRLKGIAETNAGVREQFGDKLGVTEYDAELRAAHDELDAAQGRVVEAMGRIEQLQQQREPHNLHQTMTEPHAPGPPDDRHGRGTEHHHDVDQAADQAHEFTRDDPGPTLDR